MDGWYVETCMKSDMDVFIITSSFLVYIFVDLSGVDSCLHMEQHPQLGFTFITSLDVVLFMVDFH